MAPRDRQKFAQNAIIFRIKSIDYAVGLNSSSVDNNHCIRKKRSEVPQGGTNYFNNFTELFP